MKRLLTLFSLGLLLLACDPPEVEVAVSSVSLNQAAAELFVGESVRLTATVLPADATDKTVSWKSSQTSVATVSSTGEVTAVAEGSATITASAGGKSAACQVTVKKKVTTIDVTSVTLDKDRLELTPGGVAKLTATVSPADATDKTVAWESSDAAVATVGSDGSVTAVKGGTATITAKAGGKSASALVDVMEVTPASVEISSDGGSFDVNVITTRKYHMDSKPDWVKEKSVNGQTHSFEVGANPGIEERSGVIVICDESGTCLPCNVKQAGAAPVFSISPEQVEFDAEGGTFTVTVTANHPYHLSSKPDWVAQKSFENDMFTFEVGENVEVTERSGVIVICDESGTCLPCNVKQAGADVFKLSPEQVEFDAEGGTFDLTVTATRSYHINSKPDWVTEKSVKDNVYTFEVGFNPNDSGRSGVIVVCDDQGTCLSCTVKQEGVKPFSISPMQVNVDKDGGTFEVKVTSSYGYHLNSKPDWVTEKSVKDKVHTFEVGPSSTAEGRSGAITFCDDVGTCLSMTVRQDGDPFVIDWSREFYHNPMILSFICTGSYGYPLYRSAIEEAFKRMPNKPILVNMHIWDDFTLDQIDVLTGRYSVGFPLVSIVDGRRRFNESRNTDHIISWIKEYVEETEANYTVASAVGFESSVSGRELDVDVRLYFKQAGDYKVTVFVSESGIIAGQYDEAEGYVEDYRHDDMVRMVMTDFDGDAVHASALSSKKLHYSATIPSSVKKENLKITVAVQRTYGSQPKIVDYGFDYGDYYFDNCASGKVGTVVVPVLKSNAGGGNEDVTNGDPVNW